MCGYGLEFESYCKEYLPHLKESGFKWGITVEHVSIRLYLGSLSSGQLAAKLRVRLKTVRYHLDKSGVQTRSHGEEVKRTVERGENHPLVIAAGRHDE
ncbi:MAG: hypothetical protein O6920_06025 [Chloroflexi bacterium]|nr:hypothetical protein [Chloroflexota bacterium]